MKVENMQEKKDSQETRRSVFQKLVSGMKALKWSRFALTAMLILGIVILAMIGSAQVNSNNSGSPGKGSLFTLGAGSATKENSAEMPATFNAYNRASVADQTTVKSAQAPSTGAGLPIAPQPIPTAPPEDETVTRKVTYQVNATIQVEEVASSLDMIRKKTESLGGYVAESAKQQSQGLYTASMTIRIPTEKMSGLTGWLPEVGKIIDESTRANDITNQYYDTESRLRSWQAQEKRYLEILQSAKTVEEILKIENSLNTTRLQIEQLKGQLRLWANQVSYSTIQLHLQNVSQPLKVDDPWQPLSFAKTLQSAKAAVLKTLSTTWNLFNYLLVGIAYAAPYLVFVAVLAGIFALRKRRLRRKN